jgi:hypothetical protein
LQQQFNSIIAFGESRNTHNWCSYQQQEAQERSYTFRNDTFVEIKQYVALQSFWTPTSRRNKSKCPQLQAEYTNELIFVPNRVILPEEYSYIYTTIEESLEDIVAKYETYYQDQPFVRLLPQESTWNKWFKPINIINEKETGYW